MHRFICRLGELVLKGKNRKAYENKLLHNIRIRVPDDTEVELRGGRIYLTGPDASGIELGLSTVFGLAGFAEVMTTDKTVEAITETAVAVARGIEGARSFRVCVRRADKSFSPRSPEVERIVGAAIKEARPDLAVNLTGYDAAITVEIRDRAYVYGPEHSGLRGLPSGSSGRGLLLLSGGIDSPVAGFLMAGRGLIFDAVHFHSYPYTSAESQEKVFSLARLLAAYVGTFRLYSVPVTETQLRIRERAKQREHTLLLRGCMMRLATQLAERSAALGLITGDSLAQVASQTLSNLRFTDANAGLPVYRPLVGMDKEEIVNRAREIGTFETSILPYPDCCTLFAPARPITNSSLPRMQYEMLKLDIDAILAKAIAQTEEVIVEGPPDVWPRPGRRRG